MGHCGRTSSVDLLALFALSGRVNGSCRHVPDPASHSSSVSEFASAPVGLWLALGAQCVVLLSCCAWIPVVSDWGS
eukprot:10406386-Alexandrium_andersonii.AAC.1